MLLKRGTMSKKAQAGIEYLIIIAFVVFALISILGVAFYYSGSIQDKIKLTQVTDCANKIISASESVFYSGSPSKATISCYLPESTNEVSISDNSLVIGFESSSGVLRSSFSSNVPITNSGSIKFSGFRKIKVMAGLTSAVLSLG